MTNKKLILTKNRKLILDCFKKDNKPLNSEQIYLLLKKEVDLSTIYRALDLFLENGLVKRSTLNKVSYYYLNNDEHKHYMICLVCHKMYEIECNVIDLLKNNINQDKFIVSSHDLTIYGYCKSCSK